MSRLFPLCSCNIICAMRPLGLHCGLYVFPTLNSGAFSRTENRASLEAFPVSALDLTCRKPIKVWWMKSVTWCSKEGSAKLTSQGTKWRNLGDTQPYFPMVCRMSKLLIMTSRALRVLSLIISAYNFLPQSHIHAGSLIHMRCAFRTDMDLHLLSARLTFSHTLLTLSNSYSFSKTPFQYPSRMSLQTTPEQA